MKTCKISVHRESWRTPFAECAHMNRALMSGSNCDGSGPIVAVIGSGVAANPMLADEPIQYCPWCGGYILIRRELGKAKQA